MISQLPTAGFLSGLIFHNDKTKTFNLTCVYFCHMFSRLADILKKITFVIFIKENVHNVIVFDCLQQWISIRFDFPERQDEGLQYYPYQSNRNGYIDYCIAIELLFKQPSKLLC